jgi:branched-chain amino acid transport system permease protein
MTAAEKRNFVAVVIAFAVVSALPLVDNGYWLSQGVSLAMYTVLATSWALFSGPTNYIALSTAAFYGIGMYTVAIGLDSMPFYLLVVVAGIVGAVLAFFIGLATLRIAGVYFVIFTLGMSELIRQITVWLQATMGTQAGLYVLTDMTDPLLYWLLLGLAAIVYLLGWWINRSRLGFALRIIGNDEVVAVHSGINTARAKILLFVVSSAFASITGALVSPRWSYIEPTLAFSPFISFTVVIMALFGGVNRLWGPLVGVIPFSILLEFVNRSFPAQSTWVLGGTFLLIVYFIPNGIVGVIEDNWRRWRPQNA